MQALPVGGQLALAGCLAPPASLVAPALLPTGSAFTALPGPTLFVVVFRIGGPPLPVHAALQAADGSCIWAQFRAQRLEPGLGVPRHDGDAGRTQGQAHGIAAYDVLRLLQGDAFKCQLHEVALPLGGGTLCAWARGAASEQAV